MSSSAKLRNLVSTISSRDEILEEVKDSNFFKYLPTASVLIEQNGFFFNEKAEQLVGYTADEIVSLQSWFDQLFGERSAEVLQRYNYARGMGFPHPDRMLITCKSGEKKYVQFSARQIDQIEIWNLADLTESAMLERRFKTLFDASSDALLLFDDSGIIDCNQSAIRMLNAKDKNEIMLQHPAAFSPEFQPCGTPSSEKKKEMDALAKKNGFHRFEWTHRKLTGESFPVEVTLNPVEILGDKMLLVCWHDLSEDKRKAQFIKKITDTLPSMLYVYDLVQKKNSFVNGAAFEMLGYTPEELQAFGADMFQKIVHPDDLGQIFEAFGRVTKMKDSDFLEVKYRLVKKDGTHVYTSDRSTIFDRDEFGNVTAMIGIATDITQATQMQDALDAERSKNFHAAKMATLGEMASGIAHEINNPLTIISGRASQLKNMITAGLSKPEDAIASLDRINSTVDRIAKIVKGLKSFARDGEQDPFQFVSAQQIVEETLEFCQARLKHAGLEVRVPKWDQNIELFCQSTQIQQVLLNLLNNAFDAVQDLPERWVEIQLEVRSPWIELAVVDSGHGIPEAIRQKIMEPFFTTKEVGKGTGLGLSISKGIMGAHHGEFDIDVTSKNTRFVLRLPMKAEEKAG